MTRSEALELVAEVNARWPHSQLPNPTIVLWAQELSDLPLEVVRAAVAAHDRSGERFPPTAGQLRARVVELDRDLPEWPTVWNEIEGLIRKGFGADKPPPAERCSSPLVASFAAEIGWRRLCLEGYDTTFAAQTRDAWRALSERVRRDDALVGLPDAGLTRLARVNGEPRRLGEALSKALPQHTPTPQEVR